MSAPAVRARVRMAAPRDGVFAATLVLAAAALAAALAATLAGGLLFGFTDAPSHVVTPRRVFDNLDPSFAQLGTHWTPLYHVLQLPLVRIDPLYRSGASGVIVSAAAALAAAAYLHRLAVLATGRRAAGLLAAAILVTSPSFAYAGVIPMLYATIMAAATANVFYLSRWALHGGGRDLLAAGIALTAATLAHFDTWILAPLELAVVALVARRRWGSAARTEATALLWALAGGYGIALFLLMNVMIFGDPLAFLKPFAGTGDVLGTAHHGLGALLDHPRAAWLNAGPALALAGLGGAAAIAWRRRRDPARLVPLLLFYPLAWYAFQALTSGGIIEPGETLGDWRNLRYGVTVLPALAFCAAVAPRRAWTAAAVAAVTLGGSAWMLAGGRVALWEDARHDVPAAEKIRLAARWLGSRTGAGERVLLPVHSFLVDRFELDSGLATARFVDANDTAAWRSARQAPRSLPRDVRWVVWFGNGEQRVVRRVVHGARPCLSWPVPDHLNPRMEIYDLRGLCGGRSR